MSGQNVLLLAYFKQYRCRVPKKYSVEMTQIMRYSKFFDFHDKNA